MPMPVLCTTDQTILCKSGVRTFPSQRLGDGHCGKSSLCKNRPLSLDSQPPCKSCAQRGASGKGDRISQPIQPKQQAPGSGRNPVSKEAREKNKALDIDFWSLYVHAHKHMHTQAHMCTHMHAHTNTHRHAQACTHTSMHVYVCAHTHTRRHACDTQANS